MRGRKVERVDYLFCASYVSDAARCLCGAFDADRYTVTSYDLWEGSCEQACASTSIRCSMPFCATFSTMIRDAR